MNLQQLVLGGVLLVQLIVVGIILLLNATGSQKPKSFLQFDQKEADRVVVSSGDESIELVRGSDGWKMSDGNPVDGSKVDRVLEKLADVQPDWPVATSDSAAERFEVSRDKFQKQVSVYSGDKTLADVYLGTSPSFRKVHARHTRGGDIYSIEFSNHEAGTSTSSWLDRSLLHPQGPINSLEKVGDFALTKTDDGWIVNSGEELDESKVRSYIDRFESLNVFEISDKDVSDIDTKEEFVITDDKGSYSLVIYHLVTSDDWVATSDRFNDRYGVISYQGKELFKELGDLVPDAELVDEEDELESIEEVLTD